MTEIKLPGADPRDAVRVPITLRVRLAWDEGECLAYTTNLSINGAFAETCEEVHEGTDIRVEIDLGDAGGLGRVYVDGTVARFIDEDEASARGLVPGVGIRFDTFVVGKFDLIRFLTPSKKEDVPAKDKAAQSKPDDRREASRVATGLPVVWGTKDPPDRAGQLANLSTSGAFSIQTDEPCEIGDKIYLMFELPRTAARGANRVRAIAQVMRVVAPGGARTPGMGVHFDHASVDVETIRAFVKGRRTWERQLAAEQDGEEPDWVSPSKDLPTGIEPRRLSEGAAPSRVRKTKAPAKQSAPAKKKTIPESATALPLNEINWKWIAIVLAIAFLAMSALMAVTWVFSP